MLLGCSRKPSTHKSESRVSYLFIYQRVKQSGRQDLNLRPPAPEEWAKGGKFRKLFARHNLLARRYAIDEELSVAAMQSYFAVVGDASEGAFGVRSAAIVWASDRVQDLENPSMYLHEFAVATTRVGLDPRWTSGPHVRLVDWSRIVAMANW
jgi:hypothetical protein